MAWWVLPSERATTGTVTQEPLALQLAAFTLRLAADGKLQPKPNCSIKELGEQEDAAGGNWANCY